ncbi:MAG: group II intron reverse transcriptase/maturase [Desulfobacterales bacterium]|nr:group II intron reverse transcriptase/maturase [Desulfobacterales bacterium]
MATNLKWIGEKARKEPDLVFTSLYHHISDVDNLRACYDSLEAGKATGVDGVTKQQYGRDLERNLQELSERLGRMSYRPGAKRRSYIPKVGSAKGRPLGISNFEDKIVEASVKRTLEPIYESAFEDSSYGYRPGRSQHQCLDALGRTIQHKRINYVVEADIKSFFDQVNHQWLVKFLRHRIGDERVVRLIIRMLKSGIMEDGLVRASEQGTPQGSILSPLLSNVYLHYALDLWFSRRVKPQARGEAYYFRFADDFLACFENQDDARGFRQRLEDRLEGFGLQVADDKTRSIEFGRFARERARKRGAKPEEFTFLGFTHYCGKTRRGYFKLKRRTSRKKLGASLREFTDWAKKARCVMRKGEMLRAARRRVTGHLNYYAITDNSGRCNYYVYRTTQILFKWLNRKSQRRAYTWESFGQALAWVKWPKPRIRKDLDPCRRAEAY